MPREKRTVEGMDLLIVVVLAVAALVLVGVLIFSAISRSRRRKPDDQLRAGGDPSLDSEAAARRAEGKNLWMGPGGGGSL
jgi:hypothetical protein